MGMEGIADTVNKREALDLAFERSIRAGIQDALTRVRERFEKENPERPHDVLSYHDAKHTENVIRRARLILKSIAGAAPELVTKRHLLLGEYGAANHDTVQNYAEEEKDGGIFRKRDRIRNEHTSAREATDYLRMHGIALTSEDEDIIEKSIIVTVPDYNAEHKTVEQRNLTPESEIVVRAVALADIGTAGMDGPEIYLKEGDALFREEQIDIADAMRNPATISDEQKAQFIRRMLQWSGSQVDFARGRKALLETELTGLPEKAQQAVRKLFVHFDASIQGAQAKTDRRQQMSFEELARDFGYRF